MNIRNFRKADFSAVRSIYQQGIDTGIATFHEKAKSWEEWDSSVLPVGRLISEQDEKIVAWAALSSISNRCVYSGVAEVSIYVDSNAQGTGVGRNLLSKLIECSELAGIWTLQAGIFPENKSSIHIHQINGFRQLGVREKLGQLEGVWRDVVFLERRSRIVGV